MKKQDWYILLPLLVGAIWLAFLPNKRYKYHEIKPHDLLYNLNLAQHYISTDDVAKAIIKQDPSVILIDVRDTAQYAKFTLSGALNIPFDSLLNENYKSFLDQDIYTVVLFSNGSSLADQAWLLLQRMGYKGTRVMKGGLNEWIETIIRPSKPNEFAGQDQWDLYEFRKGASFFFGGGSGNVSDESTTAPPPVVPVQRNNNEGNVGGCE
jgi:rhodanese-related sulfurtransferase